MELANIQLKLSGLVQNTVYKENVTPAQLALYAFMHGEDCVQSLRVIGIDKNRSPRDELNRLREEFTSDHASKALNHLFPGAAPHLPVTFRSMGYDPDSLDDGAMSHAIGVPKAKNSAEVAVMEKIKQASNMRKPAETKVPVSYVDPRELADALDDTGNDGEIRTFDDDPIDIEMRNLKIEPSED